MGRSHEQSQIKSGPADITRPDVLFAIYSASHVINRAYAPHLKALGLAYPQYIALTFLWENDGQSVGALTKKMRMEASTLAPRLKRLEMMGHIRWWARFNGRTSGFRLSHENRNCLEA